MDLNHPSLFHLTPRQAKLFEVLKPYLAQHGQAFVLHPPHVAGMLAALESHIEVQLSGLLAKLTAVEDGNE